MAGLSTFSLEGQTILVTGASSGIGRATAELAASLGAQVIGVGRTAMAELPGEGHRFIAADLSEPDAFEQHLKAIDGPIHGFAHFAGQDGMRPLARLGSAQMLELYEVHVVAGAMIAKALVQRKAADDALSIVLASSVAASRGQPGLLGYAAAKAALSGVTKTMAVELAPRNVRANALLIGHVASTRMSDRTAKMLPADAMERLRARHPLGFGSPEDPASAACFLLSPAARWITGATLAVDGGFDAA